MILLRDSIRVAAPSGSGIPLAAYMSMALEAIPFDRQEDKFRQTFLLQKP